jgi:hypothetical protein
MEDKRQFQRLNEESRVAVTVVSAQNAPEIENQTYFCPTEDLSLVGLKLNVPEEIPSGSQIELRVAIMKPLRSFMHHGEVRWSKQVGGRFPYAIGIKFTKLEGSNRALWQDAITRKIAISGGQADGEAQA